MDITIEAVTRDFDRWVNGFVRDYPGESGKALRHVALSFVRGVFERTPRDTGRARGGWLPYADHAGQPIADPLPGSARGKSEGGFREDLRGRDQFVEITNGVPYIVPLEYGHSKQAPAGMVRVTMRTIRAGGYVDKQFEDAVERANRKAGRG